MERTSLNLIEVGNKAKSKWELYRLLTVEGGLYLPPEDQTNMDFVSDIFFNEKKVRNSIIILANLAYQVISFKRCKSMTNTSRCRTSIKRSY